MTYLKKKVGLTPGIHIVHSDHQFFPPTNKFTAGGAGGRVGRKTHPRFFFEFIAQKDAFLSHFPPFLM